MLKLSKSLFNQPIMSLRLGGQIGTAIEPIINPHNLNIMGWWCQTPRAQRLVLLAEDVRQIMGDGLAVDDEDDLAPAGDLARHHEILEINFKLLDKPVRTKRARLGKVSDFSYNEGLFVQKLYVAKPLRKILTTEDTLLIDRTQILEITDNHILVRDTDISVSESELAAAPDALPAT